MAIELIFEGTLEKEKDREIFTEMVKEICDEKQIKFEDYDTSFLMDVCPQGCIECSYEGVFVSIVAQTNVAGPGFHAYVAQLYDEIIVKSGISYNIIDKTQYYENRDFEALKYKSFYPWLTQLCEYVQEYAKSQQDLCVCWSADAYRPIHKDGYVVTPLGYQAIHAFRSDDIEVLAQNFFIWNEKEKDASFYKNCALALLWKECYFEYSTMNDYTSKIAHMCIDYLEIAYDCDSTIALPYTTYEALCDVLQREKVMHVIQHDESAQVIGYRKGIVYYPLGNWSIAVQGFHEKNFDDVTKTMNIMAPYKEDSEEWTWLVKANVIDKTLLHHDWMLQHDTYYTEQLHGIQVHGVILQEDTYYRLIMQFEKDGEALQIDCFIHEEQQVEVLKQWCHHIQYAKNIQEQVKH